MEFAIRFSDLLESVGKTSYQFAKETGISENIIGKWRRGERLPSFENIIAIAAALDISTDYLLTGKESELRCSGIGISQEAIELARRWEALDIDGKALVRAELIRAEDRMK